VLWLICAALPNKAIALELSVSIKTVEKHRQSAMDKLNAHHPIALLRGALAHGLIEFQKWFELSEKPTQLSYADRRI